MKPVYVALLVKDYGDTIEVLGYADTETDLVLWVDQQYPKHEAWAGQIGNRFAPINGDSYLQVSKASKRNPSLLEGVREVVSKGRKRKGVSR